MPGFLDRPAGAAHGGRRRRRLRQRHVRGADARASRPTSSRPSLDAEPSLARAVGAASRSSRASPSCSACGGPRARRSRSSCGTASCGRGSPTTSRSPRRGMPPRAPTATGPSQGRERGELLEVVRARRRVGRQALLRDVCRHAGAARRSPTCRPTQRTGRRRPDAAGPTRGRNKELPMVDRGRLAELLERERSDYVQRNPLSGKAFASAEHLFGRVPMTWMNKRAGAFPLYLDSARGARGARPRRARLRRLLPRRHRRHGRPLPGAGRRARCSAGSASWAARRRCCRPRTPSGSAPT